LLCSPWNLWRNILALLIEYWLEQTLPENLMFKKNSQTSFEREHSKNMGSYWDSKYSHQKSWCQGNWHRTRIETKLINKRHIQRSRACVFSKQSLSDIYKLPIMGFHWIERRQMFWKLSRKHEAIWCEYSFRKPIDGVKKAVIFGSYVPKVRCRLIIWATLTQVLIGNWWLRIWCLKWSKEVISSCQWILVRVRKGLLYPFLNPCRNTNRLLSGSTNEPAEIWTLTRNNKSFSENHWLRSLTDLRNLSTTAVIKDEQWNTDPKVKLVLLNFAVSHEWDQGYDYIILQQYYCVKKLRAPGHNGRLSFSKLIKD